MTDYDVVVIRAAAAGLWAPDAELYPGGGRPRQGRAAIATYYTRLLAGWAEHVDRSGSPST
jgi:hypothetical protein